jgi:hypothetical protein
MEEDETGGRESNHPFIGTPHTLCSSGSRRRRKTEVGSAVTQRHVSITTLCQDSTSPTALSQTHYTACTHGWWYIIRSWGTALFPFSPQRQ